MTYLQCRRAKQKGYSLTSAAPRDLCQFRLRRLVTGGVVDYRENQSEKHVGGGDPRTFDTKTYTVE